MIRKSRKSCIGKGEKTKKVIFMCRWSGVKYAQRNGTWPMIPILIRNCVELPYFENKMAYLSVDRWW